MKQTGKILMTTMLALISASGFTVTATTPSEGGEGGNKDIIIRKPRPKNGGGKLDIDLTEDFRIVRYNTLSGRLYLPENFGEESSIRIMVLTSTNYLIKEYLTVEKEDEVYLDLEDGSYILRLSEKIGEWYSGRMEVIVP